MLAEFKLRFLRGFLVIGVIVFTMNANAAPTLVGTPSVVSQSGNVGDITISTPSGGMVGDLLLTFVALDNDRVFTPTTGWDLIANVNINGTGGMGAGDISLGIYSREATTTASTSYTFDWNDTNEAVGTIVRYSGVDLSSPLLLATDSQNPSTAPVAPEVLGAPADSTIVRIASIDVLENGAGTVLGTTGNTSDSNTLVVEDETLVNAGSTGDYSGFSTLSAARVILTATIVLPPLVSAPEIEMVSKTVSDPFPNEGDTITYTLDLINNGTLASTADISDAMPGLDYPVTFGGACTGTSSATAPATCTTTSILPGDAAIVTITGVVSSSLSDADITINTATLMADDDIDTSNDSASAEIQTCAAGLDILNNVVSVTSSYTYFSDPDETNNTDNRVVCVESALDFGDAPTATYGSPSHGIDPDLFIGSVVPDAEDLNQGSINADGDDANGTDDEEGVVFTSPAGGDHAEVTATVTVTNNTTNTATVCAWLDEWDVNGDPQDVLVAASCQTVAAILGASDYVFNWGDLEQIDGFTYLRFRVCSTSTECDEPAEAASNGEVEDYRLNFDFTPTAVTVGSVNIEPVSVGGFLAGIGAGQMTDEQLLALLTAWDPDAADNIIDTQDILDALNDYLDPDGDGQVALLIWDTLEERGTIGFFVERKTADGDWQRINDDMLPGLITAPMGGDYRLVDPGAQSGSTYEYQLIEQEATGNTNTYGPFQVEMQ